MDFQLLGISAPNLRVVQGSTVVSSEREIYIDFYIEKRNLYRIYIDLFYIPLKKRSRSKFNGRKTQENKFYLRLFLIIRYPPLTPNNGLTLVEVKDSNTKNITIRSRIFRLSYRTLGSYE